jgi:hypothetical protein
MVENHPIPAGTGRRASKKGMLRFDHASLQANDHPDVRLIVYRLNCLEADGSKFSLLVLLRNRDALPRVRFAPPQAALRSASPQIRTEDQVRDKQNH